MKLIRATVRSYRIHRDVTIEFDPQRTLVGGVNESGKSTLAEAVHRALFLPARVTGEAVESMRSHLFAGIPEVEVHFEAGGATYALSKKFGAQGTARLTLHGGRTWHQDEAEQQLTTLLRVEDIGRGRGVGDRADSQWAHLWVRQGYSFADPSDAAAEQSDALLQRLQAVGGAVVVQSPLDEQLRQHFAEQVESTRTKQRGRARANSPLAQARQAIDAAQRRRQDAQARIDATEQARLDLLEAEDALRQADAEEQQLLDDRDALAARRSRCDAIGKALAGREKVRDAADARVAQLTEIEETIAARRLRIQSLAQAGAPQRIELAQRRLDLQQAQQSHADAFEEFQAAQAQFDDAEQRAHCERARVRLADARADVARLVADRARVARLVAERADRARERESFAPVTQDDVDALAQLSAAVAQAEGTLRATAVSIERVAGTDDVLLDDRPIAAGEIRLLTDVAELVVGGMRLRIRPGGGAAVADARAERDRAQAALAARLAQCDVADQAAAAAALHNRSRCDQRIREIDAELHGLDVDADDGFAALDERLTDAQDELATALRSAEEQGFSFDADADADAKDDEADAPADEDAERAARRAADAVKRVRSRERAERERRDALQRDVDERAAALERAERAIDDENVLLAEDVRKFGDDAARAAALDDARAHAEQCARVVQETQAALDDERPDDLDADERRNERSRTNLQKRRAAAGQQKAVAEAALRSDGADDPFQLRDEAAGDCARAEQAYAALDMRARAQERLAALYREETAALSERYTQPLAERINDYVRSALGREARVTVAWDDGLQGIRLARAAAAAASTFDFDALSGGTRELLAAAVRLAVAELLAADHDGCLPVVFDDAFANCDPQRVRDVQRMLDRAADRGLQVIVLSCNPADYATLGATVVSLSRPDFRAVVAAPAHFPPSDDSAEDTPDADDIADADDEPAAAVDADDEAAFLRALAECGGASGNLSLRRILGWEEDRYHTVRLALIAREIIHSRPGRGGAVAMG
jgi:hypothetical protein